MEDFWNQVYQKSSFLEVFLWEGRELLCYCPDFI